MEIHLHGQLAAEDYVDAQRLHGRKLTYVIYAIMMAIVFFAVWGALEFTLPSIALPIAGSGFIFTLILGLWTVPRAVINRARRIFAQQKSLHGPREIWITDAEIHSKTDRAEARIPWDDFYRWKANDKTILLYSSEVLFHMLPRRWFASADDYHSLQLLLARTIGPAGKAPKLPPPPPSSYS